MNFDERVVIHRLGRVKQRGRAVVEGMRISTRTCQARFPANCPDDRRMKISGDFYVNFLSPQKSSDLLLPTLQPCMQPHRGVRGRHVSKEMPQNPARENALSETTRLRHQTPRGGYLREIYMTTNAGTMCAPTEAASVEQLSWRAAYSPHHEGVTHDQLRAGCCNASPQLVRSGRRLLRRRRRALFSALLVVGTFVRVG